MPLPDRIGRSGHKWLQHPEEIDPFLDLIGTEGANSYLEIGAFCGDTFWAVGQRLAEPFPLMVAVDWEAPMIYSPVSGPEKARALSRAVADLRDQGKEAHLIRGDSKDGQIAEDIAGLAPFDVILIDGDHSYAGVLSDWNNYGHLGRMIAFHDIAGDDRWSAGPKRLWAELKPKHRHVEFIVPGSRRGIGVLWR